MQNRERKESSQQIFRITHKKVKSNKVYGKMYDQDFTMHPLGRFPANVICSDKTLGDNSKYFDLDAWARSKGIPLETEQWVLDEVDRIEANKEKQRMEKE